MSDGDKIGQDTLGQPHARESADLVTEARDPETLLALLARARERLSFYEVFDQVIAENVRRSGELMHEALSSREMAASEIAKAADDRSRAIIAIDELESGLEAVAAQVGALAARLAETRRSLSGSAVNGGPAAAAPAKDQQVGTTLSQHSQVTKTPVEPDQTTSSAVWSSPKVIEVIAHGVDRAGAAVSLQRYLGGLEPVTGVEAREFAEGLLRLRVTASRPLRESDFAAWESGQIRPQRIETHVVEIALKP